MTKQVSPDRVVGRAKLIQHIWKTLDQTSVIFTAERRIGKTTVMKKMVAEPKGQRIAIYMDLEKVDSPTRFVEVLLAQSCRLLSTKAAIRSWIDGFVKSIGGSEIAGVIKLPQFKGLEWQPVLEKAISNICDEQRDCQLVFLFDELPYMLQKISVHQKKSGATDNPALSLLDSLRAMRNEQSNLRMVFTGSVGLHHVVTELRGTEFASQPTNDMQQVEIGPLAAMDAFEFARTLLIEGDVQTDAPDLVAQKIVELTDHVPFYIDKIISRLSLKESIVTVEIVEQEVRSHLSSGNDPWEMEHFRTRLAIYYSGKIQQGRSAIEMSKVAAFILDILSTAERPLTINEVFGLLKSRFTLKDRDIAIRLLSFLENDHYLTCDDHKRYSFRFPLIKAWWVLAQGLQS